jgi:hypothetical protein
MIDGDFITRGLDHFDRDFQVVVVMYSRGIDDAG